MTITDHLQQLLVQDERFTAKGQLLKNTVLEAAMRLDERLLKLLYSDEWARASFFKNIDELTVFDQQRFQQFIQQQSFLIDSYTAFKNKIGLHDGQQNLKERK